MHRYCDVTRSFFKYHKYHVGIMKRLYGEKFQQVSRWVSRGEILGHFELPSNMVDHRMKSGSRLFLDEFVRLELWKLGCFSDPDDRFDFLLDELSLLLSGTYENEHYDCHPVPEDGLKAMLNARVNAVVKKKLSFVHGMLEIGNVEGVLRYLKEELEALESIPPGNRNVIKK